jgi:hypothetical protein
MTEFKDEQINEDIDKTILKGKKDFKKYIKTGIMPEYKSIIKGSNYLKQYWIGSILKEIEIYNKNKSFLDQIQENWIDFG